MNKFIYWAPRILSIAFICFLALFSLDVFEENLGFWQTMLGLLIHNIPAIILAVVLWISWKWEIVGGIVYTLAGAFYLLMVSQEMISDNLGWQGLLWVLTIPFPAILIGILFFINWRKRKNNQSR